MYGQFWIEKGCCQASAVFTNISLLGNAEEGVLGFTCIFVFKFWQDLGLKGSAWNDFVK